MAKLSTSLPEAEDYLLGRLTAAERRQFEARLEQLPELRAQVRELEEGLVVLALSASPHTAPRAAWQNIEAAVARTGRWNLWLSLAGLKWFANGWGVAAGLAAVLVVHLLWPLPATPPATPAANTSAMNSTHASPSEHSSIAAPPRAEAYNPSSVQAGEHRQSTDQFEDSAVPLSQPRLPGPKGSAAPDALATACKTNLSPMMRKTMLIATARRLGLVAVPESGEDSQQVDFIDLTTPADMSPSGLNSTPADPVLAAGEMPQDNNPDPNGARVPMVASPPYILALVDPSMVPPDMNPITVWRPGEDGSPILFAMVPIRDNPIILALPGLPAASGQPTYFITAGTNHIIGQYPPP